MSKSRPLPPLVQKLLLRGIKHQRAGRMELADKCYRKTLEVDPQCAKALHLRGLVAQQTSRHRESIELILAALALGPDDPTALTSLADSSRDLGEMEQALRHYRRAAELRPQSVDAHIRLGQAEERVGDLEAGADSYRRALELQPDSPQAHGKLAGVLRQLDDLPQALGVTEHALASNPARFETYMEEALRHYRRVAELSPQSMDAHTHLGQAEERVGELEAAAASYRRALELQPDSPKAHCKLAGVLRQLDDLPQALSLCERALVLNPARFETYNELGLILTDMKNPGAAAEAFQRSLALQPDSALTALDYGCLFFKGGDLPLAADWARKAIKLDAKLRDAHLSLGLALSQMGDWGGALECYERARDSCPNSAEIIFHLGLMHLSEGNFALGWREYEQRKEGRRGRRKFSHPPWKGEPLQGARILLHAEQGLGDTLHFVRYVPLVAAQGGQVLLAVQPRLLRLLAGTEGAWQVTSDIETPADCAWHCPLPSLPRAFATDLSTIPAKIPYVRPDPALVTAWQQRLRGPSFRVGLAWGGNAKHPHEFWRSIPLEQLAPLTTLEGTTFYSLQMGPSAEQVKPLGARVHLADLQSEQEDFADTAAIVANLDLVISIDTSVAHLAGAMGKPVWVLLHKAPDWRWMHDREDSPWYPTARLFRQSTLGNWQDVITRVERELRGLVTRTAAAARDEPKAGAAIAAALNCFGSKSVRPSGSPPEALQGGEKSSLAGSRSMSTPPPLTPHVRRLLNEGIEHHRAGRLGQAEGCYRQGLKADPHCRQALHLLGLLARQAGQYEESIRLIGEALALHPDDPEALNSLADSYLGQGQIQPAAQCFQRLAELLPQSADVHHRLGKSRERLGDWGGAMESYRRALALQPNSPALHSSLGRLQSKRGAFREAVESYSRALALDPHLHDICNQLGNALSDMGNWDGALEAYRRALALKPDSAETIYGLGYFFERQGNLAAAADSYRNALMLDPRLGVAHLHLGITYHLQGDLAKAAECCGRLQELEPDSPEARSLLGLIHLQQGNLALGLSEYENRWGTTYGLRFRRKFSQPLWKGEPLRGSRILLHAEQGLGDTLQFVRYLPLVAARGGEVILEVQPRLHRLLAKAPGATEVICRDEALPEFDWQCPLLSLPLALGTELNTIPAKIPYVCPDPAQVEAWRHRLPGNSRRIGLVWAGSPLHPHELWRSVPLEQLAPLTQLEGTAFYSLQMGAPPGQVKPWGERVRLIDLQDGQKDFADTAAIVANLDLVISIDTSVAHLAGAMGKPVWILLYKSADWRWFLDREDSPWYPTARLFRQATLGDWQEVVTRVERELRALVERTAVAA